MILNNVGSARKKLKGFTLVELVVVMAIIAILAGIASVAVQGFQRDARINTANDRAQLIYTGFQNILVDCEIDSQDCSIFQWSTSTAVPDYIEVKFTVSDSQPVVNGEYDKITSISVNSNTLTDDALKKIIGKELAFNFDGTVSVYINCEDFVVDGVCCFEDTEAAKVTAIETRLVEYNRSSSKGKCKSFYDHDSQRDAIKRSGHYAGVYPNQAQYNELT